MYMDDKIRTNDVAKSTGLSKQAIRYYEDHGLLNHVRRDEHNNRTYTRDQINRLIFIKKAKDLDFSLTEILAIVKAYDNGISPCDLVADIIRNRITDLQARIRHLREEKSKLQKLQEQCRTIYDRDNADKYICPGIEKR